MSTPSGRTGQPGTSRTLASVSAAARSRAAGGRKGSNDSCAEGFLLRGGNPGLGIQRQEGPCRERIVIPGPVADSGFARGRGCRRRGPPAGHHCC